PGMHRVLSLDVTLAPRDPRAPGQFGHPVAVPADKQEEAKSRWKEGNFNVYLSDLIPVDRAIPDTRPAGCSEQQVHDDLPSTSIIMCFVDEVWSTLLRSVHSVLSRSPPHLVEEIILVDDFSTKGSITSSGPMTGSGSTTGSGPMTPDPSPAPSSSPQGTQNIAVHQKLTLAVDVSHDCVSELVSPIFSLLSYMTVDNFQRGIFTWPMNFGWKQIPQEVIEKNKINETDIIRCPVMAGGLFSIEKKYFSELGMYDPGLDVWGGENMEISFKVGRCPTPAPLVNDNPYSFPKDRVRTVERNLARVAEVWLDEYKELFYGHALHLLRAGVDVGDLGPQVQLRRRLRCRAFRWYLRHVYPDLDAPLARASGLLVNEALAGCIAVEGTTLAFGECDANSTVRRAVPVGLGAPVPARGDLSPPCSDLSPLLSPPRAVCLLQSEHLISEQQHLPQPACLAVHPSYRALRLAACDPSSPHQKWKFGSYHAD
ncbi:GALT5 acetylgalactosaminyltransferase, partial [Copsychus sechellarum]|nr:GALT5 acetylgalactosaminyltransferase [Copsychus sechellarum]